MFISKEEFVAWKNDATTKRIKQAIEKSIVENRVTFSKTAGRDKDHDLRFSGMLEGMERAWDFESLFEWDETEAVNDYA